MTIKFRVDLTPKPQERPRFSSSSKPYYSVESQNYRAAISRAAQRAMGEQAPLSCPVAVTLDFFKKRDIDSPRFGDIDNLAKAVLDSMNKIVYKDDRFIQVLVARKIQDDNEHIDIYIDF